jgi:hypothetical protein
VRRIAERVGRQAFEPRDEIGARPRHSAEHGAKAKAPGSGYRPRIEAIGMGHVEPLDAVALASCQEPEPAHRLLVAAQQVG